jgi:hypothetical protein
VQAQHAVSLCPGKNATPVVKVPHPSSHDETVLLQQWKLAIDHLRTTVTADADGGAASANDGQQFLESDYAPIRWPDLPFASRRVTRI